MGSLGGWDKLYSPWQDRCAIEVRISFLEGDFVPVSTRVYPRNFACYVWICFVGRKTLETSL